MAGVKVLKTLYSETFRVIRIQSSDGNDYASYRSCRLVQFKYGHFAQSWQRKPARESIGLFLRWFAMKGFYAEANVAIKEVHTSKSSRTTTLWLQLKSGKPILKTYADLLLDINVHSTAYG